MAFTNNNNNQVIIKYLPLVRNSALMLLLSRTPIDNNIADSLNL